MLRFLQTAALILVVIVGIWVLWNKDRISNPTDIVSLATENLSAIPIPVFQTSSDSGSELQGRSNPVFQKTEGTIRVATFKINGESGAAQKPDATRLMTEISRQFDLLAIQNANDTDATWVNQLVDSLRVNYNLDYDYISSPFHEGRQYITLFNQQMVELDGSNSYTVNDPDDLFSRPALVGWFRARGVPREQAFTFSLVNIEFDKERSPRELQHLGELNRAIRQDGRGEDDVVFAGNFQTGEEGLDVAKSKSGLQSVAASMPTNLMRTAQFDNILFSPVATVEFAGVTGVFDFMQHYNLFLDDSLAIAKNLPVWAEFSIVEGVVPGRVASLDDARR